MVAIAVIHVFRLGTTYDPLDILMFAIGVLLAAFVDRVVFWRFLPFWATR